jgi:hypothetical protein
MTPFDPISAMLVALCGLAAVTAALYAHAKAAERERTIIDLRRRVTSLRVEYAEKLAEIAARERGDTATTDAQLNKAA